MLFDTIDGCIVLNWFHLCSFFFGSDLKIFAKEVSAYTEHAIFRFVLFIYLFICLFIFRN